MALGRWKKIDSRVMFTNPWWSYLLDRVLLPSGKESEYHYVHTAGSVIILPMLPDGRLILVRQYRHLDARESLEFPAGGMRDGDEPHAIARKELIEETGRDGALEKVGFFNPCNGIIDGQAHVFIARDLTPSSRYRMDDTEEFEYEFCMPEEIDAKIRANEIYDGMTMAAWAMARSLVTGGAQA